MTETVNNITPRVLSSEQKPFNSSSGISKNGKNNINKKDVISIEKEEPHWWYDNSQSVTELFHCLSCVFPEGEAFFVRSVNYYIKNEKYQHLIDPDLKRDATAFVTQEMHHSIEHRAYNKRIELKYNHDDVEKINSDIKKISTTFENAPFDMGHIMLLAQTCHLEHITSLLGELFLGTEEGLFLLSRMAPSHRSIWAWHALEEMEHKSVAFDVYTKVARGGYFLRIFSHVVGTFCFLIGTITHVWKYLYKAGAFFSLKNHWELFYFLFIFPGILIKAIPLWLEFFGPSFHPNQRDNSKLIAKWSEKLKNKNFNVYD